MTRLPDPTTITEDSVLQLPVDFYRTTFTSAEFTGYALPDVQAWCCDIRFFAAAWCILLSRHVTESDNPLQKIRILLNSANKKSGVFRSQWSDIPAGEAVRGTEIVVTLQNLLELTAENEHTPQDSPPHNGDRGALTFVPCDTVAENESSQAVIRFLSAVTPPSDINLAIIYRNKKPIQAFIIYDRQLFLQSTIERWAGHLQILCTQLAATPDAFISDFNLLTPREQAWLNEISRGSDHSFPALSLSEQFEYQAEKRPDATALRYRDLRLTYREVNERANQLAHYLIEKGISAEQRVIMCLEPSFEAIITLMAIWKAGGCYIPLDPAYPTARIIAIIEETQPGLIITRQDFIRKHSLYEAGTLAIDEAANVLACMSTANPQLPARPETTASIFFTSGTTGRPKGVMASIANITHYINVAREQYGVTADDILPGVARFDFSISIFELMLPLTSGGTLIILDRGHAMNFTRISRTLEEVTFFHIGPSLLKGIIGYIQSNIPDVSVYSKIRHASSGGDVIPPQILESLKQIFTEAEIFVIYGCSEISCMGCTYPVLRTETITKTYVGRPFRNVTVRILDQKRRMVPAGISGEICFAGGGITKGYLNQPDLTSEKFINIEGERFYCTGDVGRLNNDGTIEILGRRDFQIQLRGMRIELGEVEYALRQAPGVQDGIVIVRTTAEGEKQLAAFIVPKAEDIPSSLRSTRIRAFMTDHLPDYMVPATYTELSSLPLNLNLKVDRRALQTMVVPPLKADSDVRNPESSTEKEFAALWTSLLGVENVGLQNNFFELGGDSLLALNFIGLVQQQYGVTLEGMEVLREPLEVLAKICDHRSGHHIAARNCLSESILTEARELFYFGPDRSLFGVLTSPTGGIREKTAVLICGANGHEHVRTTFIIHNLTRQIVRLSFPVFRFDYFGCRDALGESNQGTCSRWQQDIDTAQRELMSRTGAEHVIAIGIRFGATLLLNSSRLTSFSKLVLWDPVINGESYYRELQILHRAYLYAQPHFRSGPGFFRSSRDFELLGSRYSEKMLRELQSISIRPECGQGITTDCLLTRNSIPEHLARKTLPDHPLNQIIALPVDCFWQDPAALEEILPDTGISKALTDLIKGAP